MKEKKRIFPVIATILAIMFIMISVGFALYPTVSDLANKIANKKRNTEYQEAVNTLTDTERNSILKKAEQYNDNLGKPLTYESAFSYKSTSDYTDVLDFKDGQMGAILIPKINVNLPIYHGTGEDKLSDGAIHLPNTSLPIGGMGNHSVISAHTAYPAKVFFDDINKLDKGDLFYIVILDETLTYKVVEKNIVEPTDTSLIQQEINRDLITLITCYPYAVSSHRLLVLGERVPNAPTTDIKEIQAECEQPYEQMLFGIAAVLISITILIVLIVLLRNRKKKKEKTIQE